jgi:hypothetical protein
MNVKELPVNEILTAYAAGDGVLRIARRLRVGTQRVINLLNEHGVLRSLSEGRRMGWKNLSLEQKEARRPKRVGAYFEYSDVEGLFKRGLNASEIGSELHVDARRIRRVLVAHGLIDGEILKKPSCIYCGKAIDGHGSRKSCDDCVPNSRFVHLAAKYGVTKPVWDRMLAEQNGHCALCTEPAVCVDHCHSSNKNRGLLCSICNTSMASIDRDAEWGSRAMEYKARNR